MCFSRRPVAKGLIFLVKPLEKLQNGYNLEHCNKEGIKSNQLPSLKLLMPGAGLELAQC